MGVINQMSDKAHRIRKNATNRVISTAYNVSGVHLWFWGFRKLPSENVTDKSLPSPTNVGTLIMLRALSDCPILCTHNPFNLFSKLLLETISRSINRHYLLFPRFFS